MKNTQARKKFKNDFWQSNHYLITTLVGLDSIYKWAVNRKPDEFSTSWNPIDPARSAVRSRTFVLRSFLGATVDALDTYINYIFLSTIYFQNSSPEQKIFNINSRSIYYKALHLWKHFWIDPVTIALVRVMITWRNHIMHSSADNKITQDDKNTILSNIAIIQNEYCWLIIDKSFFDKVENGGDLTFKEVASLIKASHRYVQDFDEKVIQSIDISQVCLNYTKHILTHNISFRTKYYDRLWEKREWLVKNLLRTDIWIDQDDYSNLGLCYIINKQEII